MKKRLVGTLLCVILAVTMIAGCGQNNNNGSTTSATTKSQEQTTSNGQDTDTDNSESTSAGKVYYLNFKPEVEDVWKEIAIAYTELTGVEVKVITAASGTYEDVLRSEISKSDAPTLFQINGPVGYNNWKDYCKDLSGTAVYEALSDKSLVVSGSDGGAYGIPYTVESYGIIYNNSIMNKYFALDGALASSMDEINNFDKLKAVVEDMTAKKDDLGIQGVFASTSLLPGEDWRWQTHLANLPVYYEYKEKGVGDLAVIDFNYAENFKNIFDLYTDNSITKKTLLGSKAVSDSMAEFALGQVAMVQNGNWGWGQISDIDGNIVTADDVKFFPIYTGVAGEENQGLCTGTENFWCVNGKVSADDQKATEDFMNWLISDPIGKDYMFNKLGNAAPFSTFGENEKPSDPLAKEMFRYMENGKTSVSWNFTTFPSQTFKNNFGAALLEYCNGNMSWDDVKSLVVEEWEAEKSATAE